MGMAASQAMLLTLTSRLHDVEYKAQNIQNAKIQLATEQDEVYQKYCDALDATKIQVAYLDDNCKTYYVNANFESMCTYNPDRCAQNYAIINNKTGKVIVSPEVKEAYESCNENKYTFAYFMLGLTESSGLNLENGPTIRADESFDNENTSDIVMTAAENSVFQANVDDDNTLFNKYQTALEADDDTKKEAIDEFRDYLHDRYARELYEETATPLNVNFDDWADVQKEFQYYVSMYELIEQSGGCEEMDTQYMSGSDGDDWFNNMTQAGLISIKAMDTENINAEWKETTVSSSISKNYLQKNTKSEAEIKRAEIEYQNALDLINQKDSKYDTELKNLETEQSSIKTIMEQLKNFGKDNIQRTFNLFS